MNSTATLIPVSVIVMTKNEERNIAKCIEALRGFAEIFVVDSGSTDQTRAIARGLGAIVVDFEWNGRYPKKKQWCLENLPFSHDWALYVDADEEMTPQLAEEIRSRLAAGTEHAGYFVAYDYVFLGRILRHGRRVVKLVLLDRHRARFPVQDDLQATNMWEVEGHVQPVVSGPTRALRLRMIHHDHDSLFAYFDRHNRYSDWEAVVRQTGSLDETQPSVRRLMKVVFNVLPFKGIVAFVYFFLARGGFMDGRPGCHFAVASAFYYWQVSAKTYEGRLASVRGDSLTSKASQAPSRPD